MAEMDRVRERERPPIQDNPYERTLKYRKEFADRMANGPVVIRGDDRETFQARQGKLKFFLDPTFYHDAPLQQWRVFVHEIRTYSGRHRHQGGLVIYVVHGKGYSVVDGERLDWKKGDVVLLPLRPGGVEHQHFNLGPPEDPAKWAAFIHIPIIEQLASVLEQKEVSPDFKG
jgi:quercetin dioxygenase-like cupin family protein